MIKRILIVDDDQKFRAAVVCALKDERCLVVHAVNIREAETEIKDCRPDLLIVDGELPDGDGLNWLKSLRVRKIDIPAVFISGRFRDSNSFRQLANELDVCLVLQKPVSIQVLGDEIGRILGLDWELRGTLLADLAILAAEYARELPDRLKDLEVVIDQAVVAESDWILIERAATGAHKLRGTAGSFGFKSIGISMGWIEDALRLTLEPGERYRQAPDWLGIDLALTIAREQIAELNIPTVSPPRPVRSELDKDGRSCRNDDRLRVVLFDDCRTFTKRVEYILSADGILTYSFLDTNCVLDVLEQVKPDVVLLDMNMPERSGTAVCHLIRDSQKFNRLPIIFLSGSDDLQSRAAGMESGANAFFNKALINTELLTIIKSYANLSKLPLGTPTTTSLSRIETAIRNARAS